MFSLPARQRITRIKQHDITDCGAACLFSVAGHYGHRLPISRIRQYASTDRKGTNVLGMVEAATRLGFVAKGVKGPFESLFKIPRPAIAHVIVQQSLAHFVVIYDVTPRHVVVMDPGDGRVHRLSHQEFQAQWTGVLVLLVPGSTFRPGNETCSPLRRFARLIQPHRTVMLQALVGAGATTLLGLSTAIYVQKIVDHVIPSGNRNLLHLLSVLMIALLLAQVLLGWMKDLLVLRTGQKIDAQLILGYYQHLLRLPQRFFDTMRVGEIISRVNDAVKIRVFINDVALDLVVNVLVVLFSFGLLSLYSWKLALVVFAALPVYAAIFLLTNRANRRNERKVMESAADLEAQLVESLNAVSTIKRFGIESFSNLRTEAHFVRLLRPVYRSGTTALFAGNSSELASRLATIALLWVGSGLVLGQALSPGSLMSCYALLGYLLGPAGRLIAANRTVQEALIAADRLFEILDLEQEAAENRVELTPDRVGDVRFEQVCFRYGSRARVFEGLDLVIPHGRLTAVVGESGSGKSTLASLLQGLYPVDGGRIRIGELDLRYVSPESLRRLVGVVPQTVELFSGDVVENIALGEFEPDMGRVLELCARLGIAEFVEQLPAGYHTRLGENGATLSGGQRQRIAIARALYRSPEILLLDEATSALDSVSEQYVQQVVAGLRREGRTIIVIAHRLSTVQRADRIVVLDAGRVAEEGTHHELMLREGAYYRLWRHQFPAAPDEQERSCPSLLPTGLEACAGAGMPSPVVHSPRTETLPHAAPALPLSHP